MILGAAHESNFQSLPVLEILVVIIGILRPYYSHELGMVLCKVSGQAIRGCIGFFYFSPFRSKACQNPSPDSLL